MRKLTSLAAALATTAMLVFMPAVASADDGDTSDQEPAAAESAAAEGSTAGGAAAEGTAAEGTAAGVAMHRLYNPYSGEHFYTSSTDERAKLTRVGWINEGVGWTAPESSATPVYRLYNAFAGDHHYTMGADERDYLTAAGWTDEGIGWYSDDTQGVPLFREYNPNEPANNHNYTTDAEEHDHLVGLGWQDEGYAWYGLAAQADPAADDPAADDPAENTFQASVKVQGYDAFTITVDEENAPITAANFRTLVENGYYNGKAFYRIDEGFCLQGGTKGDNAAGNDPDLEPIVGEFSSNGHANPLADDFRKGVVAMARTNDPNSATSTFFVTLDTSKTVSDALNGNYAAFGTIDEAGMQVVDKICSDHIEYATGDRGAISDSEHMPRIETITIAG